MIKTVYVCDWKGCSEEYAEDIGMRGVPPGWYEVTIVWTPPITSTGLAGGERIRRAGIVCGKHVDAMPGMLSLPEIKS